MEQPPQTTDHVEPVSAPVSAPQGGSGQDFFKRFGTFEESRALWPEIKQGVERFMALLKGPILKAIVVVASLGLLVDVVVRLLQVILNLTGLGGGFITTLITGLIGGLGGALVGLAIAVLHVALFRPAHDQLTGFVSHPPASFKRAIAIASPALVPVLLACLMCGGVTLLGAMFCLIPGVLAFTLLLPMRYLSATRPDFTEYKFSRVLATSIEIGQAYWGVMLGLLVALTAASVVGVGVGTALELIMGLIGDTIAEGLGHGAAAELVDAVFDLAGMALSWAALTALLCTVWVLEGGVMSVLSRKEPFVNQ